MFQIQKPFCLVFAEDKLLGVSQESDSLLRVRLPRGRESSISSLRGLSLLSHQELPPAPIHHRATNSQGYGYSTIQGTSTTSFCTRTGTLHFSCLLMVVVQYSYRTV